MSRPRASHHGTTPLKCEEPAKPEAAFAVSSQAEAISCGCGLYVLAFLRQRAWSPRIKSTASRLAQVRLYSGRLVLGDPAAELPTGRVPSAPIASVVIQDLRAALLQNDARRSPESRDHA